MEKISRDLNVIFNIYKSIKTHFLIF